MVMFFFYFVQILYFVSSLQEQHYLDGLLQDCSITIADALEILQSCTEPSVYGKVLSMLSMVMRMVSKM